MFSKFKNTRFSAYADSFIVFASAAFLIVLLTNLIPLIQIGILPEIGSKTRYGNIIRIASVIYAVLLVLSYVVNKKQGKRPSWVDGLDALVSNHSGKIVFLLSVFYACAGIITGFARHEAFETRAFDLGIFAQVMWTTLHGDFLMSSIKENICLLGDHFSPILALLAPIYAFWQDPRNLLIVQAIAVAMNIPAIYLLARNLLKDNRAALFFAAAFFLYMPAKSLLHDDFHPEVLVEPFMILAFYFLVNRRNFYFILSLLAILSAKENLSGVVFGLGFYAFCFLKRYRMGSAIMIFSVLYLVVFTKWVIPAIGNAPYLYAGSYDELFKQPLELLKQIFSGESFGYVFKAFFPLLFFSFFSIPALFLTFPVLVQNLISENPATRSFNYHYTVGLTSFIFISAILGYENIIRKGDRLYRCRYLLLSAMLFVSLLRSGPAEYYYFYKSFLNVTSDQKALRAELRKIPEEAVVLTHNNVIPQLVNRRHVYQFDYRPAPSKLEQARKYGADYIVMYSKFWEPQTAPLPDVRTELEKNGYSAAYQDDFSVILKKEKTMVE